MTTRKRRRADGALALKLFDQTFGPSWATWRSWLCATLGLLMTDAEAAIFRQCTGRSTLPTTPARESWNVIGRRGGKSRMAAFVAVFLAAFRTYPQLVFGERAVVLVIAADRRQARVVFQYVSAFIDAIPALADQVTRRTNDTIELANGLAIEIATSSFRSVRGYTIVAAVLDEIAYFPNEDSANPDVEIVRAIRPSLASVPGSLLLAISSPYATAGELWRHHEQHFGREGEVLVWQSDTRTMNPTIAQQTVDQAIAEDAASASAEWLGQFRSDLERLFSRDALDAVVVRGRFERPRLQGVAYVGFVDPSGGSSDSMTLAIAHREATGIAALDLVREVRPPFSPEGVVSDFAGQVKKYGITFVVGDRYAGEWPREQFRKHGIQYEPSELTRSELYLELVPAINSGALELLDHPRLVAQLAALERRTGRSGKDSIDHQRGSHDDVANAAAGALVTAVRSVGLKAPYPTDFNRCQVWNVVPWAANCFLLGGSLTPNDPICVRHCSGHRAAHQAYTAHLAKTAPEDVQHIVRFVRENFADNEFTSRHRLDKALVVLGL